MRLSKRPAVALATATGSLRKTVRRLLAGAYPVSEAANRVYRNDEFIELVNLATARRSSLADTSEAHPRLPDSDSFHYHLHSLDANVVAQAFQATLESLLAIAGTLGYLNGSSDVAVDRHNEDFYGKEYPWVMGKKHQHGTNKAHAYLTSQRLQGPRLTLDLQRLHPLRDQHAALKDILDNTLKRQDVGTWYLDKGFYNRVDLALLRETGCDFVVPAPQDRFIRRNADTLWRAKRPVGPGCHVATMDHQVGDSRHGPTPVLLVFLWEPDAQEPSGYRLFVYSCPRVADDQQLYAWAKSYRTRWGIETGYRVTEHHRIRTTTTHYPNRLFLSCMVFLLDNAWRILRHALQKRQPGAPLLTMPRFRRALLATPKLSSHA